MTTTFLSRVDRGIRDNIPSDGPGPGAYASFAPFSNSLPGFAPFASSTSRFYFKYIISKTSTVF